MANIMVPDQVFPGFKIITELSNDQLLKLIDFLKNYEIGKFYGDIANELTEILNVDGDNLFRTLLSFIGLSETDVIILSKNLAESYKELSKVGLNTKEINKLKANLIEILSNFNRIQLSEKVREYKLENANNLRDFKLLTDIRFVDNKDQNEIDKYGIILHKLYLEYQNSIPLNELHLNLNLNDLIELKAEIEKAIERDKIIRDSIFGDIKLI